MTDDEILNCYSWATGSCFRCAAEDVQTALVALLRPATSPPVQIRACSRCLLVMEAERRLAAARAGRPYEPGRIGAEDADSGRSAPE